MCIYEYYTHGCELTLFTQNKHTLPNLAAWLVRKSDSSATYPKDIVTLEARMYCDGMVTQTSMGLASLTFELNYGASLIS